MSRQFPTLAAPISLLLAMLTAGVWVRSYYANDVIARDGPRLGLVIRTLEGSLVLGGDIHPAIARETHWSYEQEPRYRLDFFSEAGTFCYFVGFAVATSPGSRFAILPFWFLVILLVVLPALQLRKAIRGRLARHIGCCGYCGYDMRATPLLCPECGRATSAAPESDWRMRFVSTLSLLLALLSSVMWVRSRFVADRLTRYQGNRLMEIASERGELEFFVAGEDSPRYFAPALWILETGLVPHDAVAYLRQRGSPQTHARFGFAWANVILDDDEPLTAIAVPFWFVVAVLLAAPAVQMFNRKRRVDGAARPLPEYSAMNAESPPMSMGVSKLGN